MTTMLPLCKHLACLQIMPQKLFENEYGFSVKENNPFFIFPYLQKKAKQVFSDSDIYDLSRGDPGLGACPSTRVRKLFSFLSVFDTYINSTENNIRIHQLQEGDAQKVEELLKACADTHFQKDFADECLESLEEVIIKLQNSAKVEGKELSRFSVLKEIFSFSKPFGGSYHLPIGEEVVKMAVSDFYRTHLGDESIRSHEFILSLGVNDAIGTLFKMLGENGLGFLKKGDTIAVSAPAYAPYFNEINIRGLKVVEVAAGDDLSVDFSSLEECDAKIKAFFLITPNNPTGTRYSKQDCEKLAAIAEKHDSLIITDEIYAPFYHEQHSVWNAAKKRTVFLCGRSKIERSPGLRFGDVLISDETNDYLSNNLLTEQLKAPDFKTQFVWSKAPGENHGSFQHTAMVPGPSQILGMLYVLLGEQERQNYIETLDKNMDVFFEELGLPRQERMYYGLFDLNAVPGAVKQDIGVDQKLFELATRCGVILIPALKFFSEKTQKESDKTNFVRVSLANLDYEKTKMAGRKIRQYLCEE